jgi:hypothetical protein
MRRASRRPARAIALAAASATGVRPGRPSAGATPAPGGTHRPGGGHA